MCGNQESHKTQMQHSDTSSADMIYNNTSHASFQIIQPLKQHVRSLLHGAGVVRSPGHALHTHDPLFEYVLVAQGMGADVPGGQ